MNALDTAGAWLAEGRKVAIATVIEEPGVRRRNRWAVSLLSMVMAISEGAVSGGCVEGDVITAAQDAISTGQHKVLSYGVADETAWQVGLACGGKIRILVEAVK